MSSVAVPPRAFSSLSPVNSSPYFLIATSLLGAGHVVAPPEDPRLPFWESGLGEPS